MTSEQKYGFDLNGYVLIDGYLKQDQLETLDASWAETMGRRDLRDISFGWGGAWTGLLDFGSTKPLLQAVLGRGFRVDHAFMLSEHFQGQKGRMHQSHKIAIENTPGIERLPF